MRTKFQIILPIRKVRAEEFPKNGFTLIEIILVVMIMGILSALAIPQFQRLTLKAKQKEASILVSTYLNAVKMHYTENGTLPLDSAALSNYISVVGCYTFGAKWCQADKPSGKNPQLFIKYDGINGPSVDRLHSVSGNYHVFWEVFWAKGRDTGAQWKIAAIPIDSSNGYFSMNGYEVRGCFNVKTGVQKIWNDNVNPAKLKSIPYENYYPKNMARERVRETFC